ncbi:MAG TPA: hypothetical protein VG675_02315 [Bryobacteraceae bacterium]|nr:hypothetical protein [Bryobacteraceae bacterium]
MTLAEAIESRDKEIRSDLIEFVRGARVRVDVCTPAPTKQIATAITLKESPPTLAPFRTSEASEQSAKQLPLGTNIAKLKAAYAEDPAVRAIIDHFASRQRNRSSIEVNALHDKLARSSTPVGKQDLIRALRLMGTVGVGRFLVGRRGQATRFEWYEKSLTVRKLATD